MLPRLGRLTLQISQHGRQTKQSNCRLIKNAPQLKATQGERVRERLNQRETKTQPK